MLGSTHDILEAHSRAKVALIKAYLQVYLNILERTPFFSDVHVLDLLCGEGQYLDGANGTALEIIDAVKLFCERNPSAQNRITIWLNDLEKSKIEEGVYKIERVKRLSEPVIATLPRRTVTVKFYQEDAHAMAHKALREIRPSGPKHALFILDPYGYKGFSAEFWKEILRPSNTEVIQFLPATFMERFASVAVESVEPQYLPLKEHLQQLFGNGTVNFNDIKDFLRQYMDRLQEALGVQYFLTHFDLETATGSVFTLLFMTRSLRGLEVMVNSIWDLDPERGEGHRPTAGQMEFLNPGLDLFESELVDYIRSSPTGRSNMDVIYFTLKRTFKTTHAQKKIEALQKSGNVVAIDSTGAKTRGLYLSYSSKSPRELRDVTIRWVSGR